MKCSVCQRVDDGSDDTELRPYGANGSLICFDCMTGDPAREAEAHKQFTARLDVASEETGIAAIGSRDGPMPFKD